MTMTEKGYDQYGHCGRDFYLNVPYKEKNEAKESGARWDPDNKKWYIRSGMFMGTFIKWIEDDVIRNDIQEMLNIEEKKWQSRKDWELLPPRSKDFREILKVAGVSPVKISYGFCGACDSDIHDEWVVKRPNNGTRFCIELSHLSDWVGIDIENRVRPSEMKILLSELESYR